MLFGVSFFWGFIFCEKYRYFWYFCPLCAPRTQKLSRNLDKALHNFVLHEFTIPTVYLDFFYDENFPSIIRSEHVFYHINMKCPKNPFKKNLALIMRLLLLSLSNNNNKQYLITMWYNYIKQYNNINNISFANTKEKYIWR